MKLQIESVDFLWKRDDYGDVSYLDRTPEDHYGKDGANWAHVSEEEKAKVISQYGSIQQACIAYAEEDQNRLAAYKRGDWWLEGIYAIATVRPVYDNGGTGVSQQFTSGGLWGIESDRTAEHSRMFAAGQLHELKQILEEYGVDTSNLWELAGIPEDHPTL